MALTLLDKDLAQELLIAVRRDGWLWESLPTVMKMRYLAPYVKRQEEREAAALASAQPNSVAA